MLEPCLAVGGTTINYTECDSANITSITLEDCSIIDAYLTAADWSVNATVTTDGTSSSDYGDNVSMPLDDIMYSDFIELLEEEMTRLHKFDELASDGFTLDQIRAIKNVSFFREDNNKLLNKEYVPNVIRLIAYLKRVSCPDHVIDYLASQMLSEFEPYISKSFCDVELLSFVRRFFKNNRAL